MKLGIQAYETALINIWTNSFRVEHINILTHGCVIKWLAKLDTNYYNNVYSESHRKKPKKKGSAIVKKSIRQLNWSWREKSLSLSKKSELMIDRLLDLEKDTGKVTVNEKIFYEDQKSPREYCIIKKIDLEYPEAK